MRTTLMSITASGLVLTAWNQLVAAPAAGSDPQQSPAIRGDLERLTLTARGDIDGFILKDGTEVKTAPPLATQIASAIKPGDRVTVRGLKAAALPLFSAASITDETTQRTITDSDALATTAVNPPPPPAPPLRGGPPQLLSAAGEASGKVRMALHGPQGEVNGVLLESGTILRFPPDQAGQLAAMIQPHQAVLVEGPAITNAWGTVVDVQQLGGSRDQLVAVGPPARPLDDRGLGGPRRRPPLPPAQGAPQSPPPPAPGGAPGRSIANAS